MKRKQSLKRKKKEKKNRKKVREKRGERRRRERSSLILYKNNILGNVIYRFDFQSRDLI